MRNLVLVLTLLASAGTAHAAPAPRPEPPASAVQGYSDVRVRIFAENDRDSFRSGERVRLSFRTDRDAYVAVVHLTSDGEVEFLFPNGPWEDGLVRGGRSYALPQTSGSRHVTIRGSEGIGYFFAVASEEPLDFGAFQDRYARGWEFRRVVRGDPYYALDRIAYMLTPEGRYGTDAYSYYVGRRASYPRYACYDGYAEAGFWGGYYDSCDRLRGLLRDHPNYYDTRSYQGYRGRGYLADSRRDAPLHRYKERSAAGDRRSEPPLRTGTRPAGSGEVSRTRPEPLDRSGVYSSGWERDGQQQPAQGSRPAAKDKDERSRPVLQRRPGEIETSRPRVTAPPREPRRETPREPPREQPRSEPRESSRPSGEARVRPEGQP